MEDIAVRSASGPIGGSRASVPEKRLLQLNSLRAFAILFVLFEHWSGLRKWVPIGAGTLGVDLFFTLSGFLITGILLQDIERRRSRGAIVLVGFIFGVPSVSLRLYTPFF